VIAGFVMFLLGQQSFALGLDDVHEIVRLDGLEQLPGMQPPMAGVIVLRGTPLPVLDLRAAGAAAGTGDVLVMDLEGSATGIAVDQVISVVSAASLPEADEPMSATLPPYVIGIRRGPSGPVLLVDLRRLLDATPLAVPAPAAG
jgi:purine-binding chemotaxis protein CheW